MLPRVSAAVCLRPGPRLPWGPSAPLAARTNNIQRYFGTTRVICSKKDEQSVPPQETSKETEGKDGVKEKKKKDLLDIIKGMKIELSALNVRTTKPPSRRPVRTLPTAIGRPRKAAEDAPKQSFSNLISDMKVDRNATARVSTRPVHQIQFDEGPDHILDEKTINVRKSIQRSMSKGKRLNIFELKTDTAEAPGADEAPTLWDVEFAKQLATVSQQPFRNGFEEMIEWTKEGKLWTFPIDNEAGFDDDGSEFHEHIFLDKYLEDFPKQGPIRHFMELVTCGLSKNPYLSVKQKVEHIEWFRNYFNEKQDILKESGIQFS
ncbi:28S ribosomal protein S31, mitochondrial isoform X2 [Sorex araneus]|uniref:28S ribosomal protein S31, mitochondrial isoform X2 n=1 Tax=Sorex araneus TaxID=42254 RepID=UPI002433BA00|nr:28S ribosomal protein S31, mitochondrial isoform X2 [Sorex araneus]